jgi:MYXO-CTERM domain-containing protein
MGGEAGQAGAAGSSPVANPGDESDEGCSCSVPGNAPRRDQHAAGALLGLLFLMRVRRRRPRR